MSILIFGNGWLGNRANKFFKNSGIIRGVDITDKEAVREVLKRKNPYAVINLAGKNNVDWCEENREITKKANIDGPINLAEVCHEQGIYFVHIGTGCFYSGYNNGNGFKEDDPAGDIKLLSYYSQTKYQAEKELRKRINNNYRILILRIRLPIDCIPFSGKNLLCKLIGFKHIVDIPESITIVPEFLHVLRILMWLEAIGVYNVTNPGIISPKEIMEMYDSLVPEHAYKLITQKEFEEKYPGMAPRSHCSLNTDKLQKKLAMTEIHDGVHELMYRYFNRSC